MRGRVAVIQLATVAAFLGVWEAIGRSGLFAHNVLPPMSDVVSRLFGMLGSSAMWFDFEVTGWEIGAGLVFGIGIGLLLGLAIALRRGAWPTLEPLLYYASSMPKIILLPVLLLYLGTGLHSKAGMAAVSAAFPVIVTTAVGIGEVRELHVRAARMLGAGRWQILRTVYLPAAAGPILSGVRLGLGVAITGALLAETSVADAGVGFRAINDYQNLHIVDMYAVLLLVFLMAVAINAVLGIVLARVTRYTQAAPREVFS